jgi:hypothetical protein
LKLILDKERIPDLKGPCLKDQVRLIKSTGAPNLQNPGPQLALVADMCKALTDAIDLYIAGTWKLPNGEKSGDEQDSVDEDAVIL